jgi:two-component system sensor histidine kinase PilS (NtrC family)
MSADGMTKRLKALIAFRVLFVTILLGSFFVFNIGYSVFPYPSSILHLIVFMYLLTIAYSLLVGRVASVPFAYAQLLVDVATVQALIFLTGGIESWFSSLMILLVMAASIVINRKAGYVLAVASSILYGSLIDLQFYKILPIPYDQMLQEKDFLYNIFSHFLALYVTAYLTGHLTARLEKKDTDFRDLSLFNSEVIENTPSGLFTTDLDGTVALFNKSAEKITGIARGDVVGTGVSAVFPFVGDIRERARLEETVDFGGLSKVIGLSISKMQDAKGSHIGFIGTFQDLTEIRKLSEEIKRKEQLATIGELSANIAHEIRNPLASLKGSVEMLREDSLLTEQRDKLMSIALREMDRLDNIISDFLNFSRPKKLEAESFDLHGLLDETLALLENREGAPVTINRDFPGSAFIKADPGKMQQVFMNLGVNAMEAMPGGGELTVSTRVLNGRVEITFRDTGTGISPGTVKNIFFPFFTTKPRGTGLGLSIAYRIVEDHNGKITVRSGPEGTRFDIFIPSDYGNGNNGNG